MVRRGLWVGRGRGERRLRRWVVKSEPLGFSRLPRGEARARPISEGAGDAGSRALGQRTWLGCETEADMRNAGARMGVNLRRAAGARALREGRAEAESVKERGLEAVGRSDSGAATAGMIADMLAWGERGWALESSHGDHETNGKTVHVTDRQIEGPLIDGIDLGTGVAGVYLTSHTSPGCHRLQLWRRS